MRTWTVVALLATAACGAAEIEVEPDTLAWGEVDFAEPRPDDGYDARRVTIRNVGSRPVDLALRNVDETRLLVSGQFTQGYQLPTLEPERSLVLTVGVWAYVPGEWDTLVEGHFRVRGDQLRDDVPVSWSFTPVRNL
jgi:hypothetical protein